MISPRIGFLASFLFGALLLALLPAPNAALGYFMAHDDWGARIRVESDRLRRERRNVFFVPTINTFTPSPAGAITYDPGATTFVLGASSEAR